jgi:hypothetical protein
VQAAALVPGRRAGHDELGDGGDIAQLEQIAGDQVFPVILADLLLEQGDPPPCAAQPGVGSHDADVVPHGAAELVPVVGDHDRLVARHRVAGLPLGDLGERALAELADLRDQAGGAAMPEDQALEQRVRGEAVGAVEPGERALADRPQPGDAGAPVEIGADPAAHVMGGGHHRNGVGGDIDAEAQALRVNGGEMLAHEARRAVGDVEQHVLGPGAFHLEIDRPGDDIARGQVLARIVVRHERGAVGQAQDRPLAAERLADEEALRHRVEEAGRVELIELHVPDLGACPVGHCHAVARRHVGVGCIQVNLSRAAGGEHRGPREVRLDDGGPAGGPLAARRALVEHVRAGAVVGATEPGEHDQVDRGVVLGDADPRVRGDAFEQRALDLGAGGVGGVDDPARRVSSLAAEADLPVALIEAGASRDELADPVRAFAAADRDDDLVAEPGAGDHRVVDMRFRGVVGAQDRGDASLRVLGVRLVAAAFGHDDDLAVLGRVEREREPGDTAADHQKVGLDRHGAAR